MAFVDTLVEIAPFTVRLRSPLPGLDLHLETFYRGATHAPDGRFHDFDIELLPGRGLRRWWRPQVRFVLDGHEHFLPLPAEQAGPVFEWGLNWAIASQALGYLVMHAAVLARNGRAIMLPGFPGAGKSTLCASLALIEGWQLLSDELAILEPDSGLLLPHPRPISLKNASIEVVRAFPGARLGPVYSDTRKGTVTHAAVPEASLAQARQSARCQWILFPRFVAGQPAAIEEIERAEAFKLIAEQSFNRERMGGTGFDAMMALLGGARCFVASYPSTADGLAVVREICSEA
ncbi:HprK-related kinase A [Pelomonas sp. V22]|uniref:HprK-related kinase A n=1 Tax=Pelomonas sp. V22 TaxID=2822139 RepID=UPI0024A914CD|nr:HprK-related kinase A [Pelomonas sp. V22]MDI4634494.1 HprK-related kinase A [Pelomonas sp. V22]